MSPTEHGLGPAPAQAKGAVIVADGAARGEALSEEAGIAGAPELVADSIGEYARIWVKRVRSGESGALPIIVGLIAIVVFFQTRNSLFLSARSEERRVGKECRSR